MDIADFFNILTSGGKELLQFTHLSTAAFRRKLDKIKGEWADGLFDFLKGNISEFVGESANTTKLLWIDLFHAHWGWDGISAEGANYSYRSLSNSTDATAAWKWFQDKKNFFSFTSRIFAQSKYQYFVISTKKMPSGLKNVEWVHLTTGLIAQLKDQCRSPFSVSNVDSATSNLKVSSEYEEFYKKIGLFGTRSTQADVDREYSKNGALRFLILAYYTDRHAFDNANGKEQQHLFYAYIPAVAEFGKVVSGAVVAFTASSMDITLEKLQHLQSIACSWAYRAVLAEDRHIFIHQAARSARAAVFARNFSHITGSHVISNPEFRNALVGEQVMRIMRRQLDDSHRDFARAENDLFRTMLEDDFSAEKHWTEGTKILDSARTQLRTGAGLLENTRRFHEYLQGRFDFIARAIDDTKDEPEPLSFVSDLLEGFLLQTALLDNLVADVGINREQMRFVVSLPCNKGEAKFEAGWTEDPKTHALNVKWDSIGDSEIKDIRQCQPLIALPGGMVSVHAFYSLLENIIRNSAKYGTKRNRVQERNRPYELNLQLLHFDSHFELRIWDNYSDAKDQTDGDELWKVLQGKLKKNFVDSNGAQMKEGLGLLEMQACAGMVCKKIKKDEDSKEEQWPGYEERHTEAKICTTHEVLGNLWVEEPTKPVNGAFPNVLLTYHLSINAPVLLGLLGSSVMNEQRNASWCYKDLTGVRERWPHILVINGQDGSLNKWMVEIGKNHHAYPYRILVITDKPDPTYEGKGFLTNRVRFRSDPSLHARLFPSQETKWEKKTEEKAVLDAYDAWIRAWKVNSTKDEVQWHLWIGMERDAKQVREAWKEQLEKFDSSLIGIGVRAFEGATKRQSVFSSKIPSKEVKEKCLGDYLKTEAEEKAYWRTETTKNRLAKSALVFDNHGNCFPDAYGVEKEQDFHKATRFYQKLTGSLTPDLFHTLSHPPKDNFLFSFFIYSLVEACLTDVIVVDERVAWSLVDGGGDKPNPNFTEELATHQKAGVFPIFRFQKEGSNPEAKGHYNTQHFNKTRGSLGKEAAALDDEGVMVDATNGTRLTILKSTLQAPEDGKNKIHKFESSSATCDVLLIHEGAMEIIAKAIKWNMETDVPELYQIAPVIVRTSGRGRESKHLGNHRPFIEFGEVSSALLTSRNKYSLVRGLLGSAGGAPKPD